MTDISSNEKRIIIIGAILCLTLIWIIMFYSAPKNLKFIHLGNQHQIQNNFGVEFIETTVDDVKYLDLAKQYKRVQKYFHLASFVTFVLPIMLLTAFDVFNRRERNIIYSIALINALLSILFTRCYLTLNTKENYIYDFKIDDSLWAFLCFANYFAVKYLIEKFKCKTLKISNGLVLGLIVISGIELLAFDILRI